MELSNLTFQQAVVMNSALDITEPEYGDVKHDE